MPTTVMLTAQAAGDGREPISPSATAGFAALSGEAVAPTGDHGFFERAGVFERADAGDAVGAAAGEGRPQVCTASGARTAFGTLGPHEAAALLAEAAGEARAQRWAYRFVKRTFDIAFSGCVLAAGLIPGLVLALAIRIESPGNPFYGQERIGRTHRDGMLSTFRMWKFRSMYEDADERLAELLERNEIEGAMFKMHDDPRVTNIGRFIRRHSIDEMPQFVNVFLGQMSVVGPRPPLPREIPAYTEHDLRRLAVKPGLTGPWQVGGRSDVGFSEMVELDLEYIERRGVFYDLQLILKTVAVVFTGEGAA